MIRVWNRLGESLSLPTPPFSRRVFAVLIAMWMSLVPSARAAFTAQSPGEHSTAADGEKSQTQASDISVRVRVVNVLATVRDKHGKIISTLNQQDFTLLEDGKPVRVEYFSRETDLPLTAGLLVDTSLSQRNSIDQEKSASKAFIAQVLRQKDNGFVIHFDKEVELLQDLTSSQQKLEDALESLQIRSLRDEDNSSRSNGGGGDDDDGQRQRGHGMHRGGTTLYDSIYLASDELMKKQQGRKALIVLSDGVDRGSKETLESAIEAAQRADTLVYAVLFKGEEAFGRDRGGFGYPRTGGPIGAGRRRGGGGYPQESRPNGKKVLERISRETGGHFFEASKKQPIGDIYKTIEDELRNEYSLGFTPDKSQAAGYHKIQLKTNQKDDQIQTRDGFYLE